MSPATARNSAGTTGKGPGTGAAALGGKKSFPNSDYLIVNRFESHGGGWGYSAHSIEAIR